MSTEKKTGLTMIPLVIGIVALLIFLVIGIAVLG